MREFLFRGKATNREKWRAYRTSYKNGDWVYGFLTDAENYAGFSEMINTNGVSGIEVDKNTVGQFIGLTDKNGTKIFEGDIIKHYNRVDDPTSFDVGRVFWDSTKCRWLRTSQERDYNPEIWSSSAKGYVIIGNVYDNPELIGINMLFYTQPVD